MRYGGSGSLLDADFLQFYHRDLDAMVEDSPLRAYALLGELPEGSRLSREENGGEPFSHRDMVEVMKEYWLHYLVWFKTEDAQQKKDPPQLMLPFHVEEARKAAELEDEATEYDLEALVAATRQDLYGTAANPFE